MKIFQLPFIVICRKNAQKAKKLRAHTATFHTCARYTEKPFDKETVARSSQNLVQLHKLTSLWFNSPLQTFFCGIKQLRTRIGLQYKGAAALKHAHQIYSLTLRDAKKGFWSEEIVEFRERTFLLAIMPPPGLLNILLVVS